MIWQSCFFLFLTNVSQGLKRSTSKQSNQSRTLIITQPDAESLCWMLYIKAWVASKAQPLLCGECMSLQGQLLGINCDCDSAEWQQLCSVSKGKVGAGRGEQLGGKGSQAEGGRNRREQCWVSGSPSNLRHLTAAWNMEAWAWVVELNATPRTDKGDGQG